MKKHMTFDDRLSIQEGLRIGLSFSQIARDMGKERSTVSREIQSKKRLVAAKGNVCLHRKTCNLPSSCKTRTCKISIGCVSSCNQCKINCEDFEEQFCKGYKNPPYVCNGCKTANCKYSKWIYEAKYAQKMYEANLSEARRGIAITEEELEEINETVAKLVKNGLSIPVACQSVADTIPVSERTIYTYIEKGLLDFDRIDLRRTVQRRCRKKSGPHLRVDKACHKGRSHEEFVSYMEEHPDLAVIQMDSVIGRKGGKVLLTIFLTNCNVQLMYLRERNTARSVSEIFKDLRKTLGKERFESIFQVILADRGSEFTDPIKIEIDQETGEEQCKFFYCDPMNSNQKSGCERNHELIRYIIAKGKSMDEYEQEDITKMMNHINSYPRKKWNGQSPLDLFIQFYGEETAQLLGFQKIEPHSILLRPELLKK